MDQTPVHVTDAVFVITEEDSSVGRMARLNLQNAQRLLDWERQTPEYERKIKSFEDRFGYLGPFPLGHNVYSSGPNKRVKSSDAPDECMSIVTSSGTPQAHEAMAMVTSSGPTSTTPKVLSSEVGDTKQAVFVLAVGGRQDGQAAFVSAVEGCQAATESGNALVATASHSVTEKTPLHTAESQNCASSPKAPFPSPTSTTPKILSSEVGDTKKDVFVLAGEVKQDAQAVFDSAGEGSQKPTESGNALVATASPSVMKEAPLDTAAESKNCPSSPPLAPLPSPTSTTPKALPSEVGATQPVATTSPSVMEKAPLDTAESKNCPCSPASAPLPSPTSTTLKALAFEVGDTKLVVSALPSVMVKVPLDTAELKNCPGSPASAPLPSPASTTPKALSSEVGDKKLVRVKRLKKSYYTITPRRSPILRECCNNPEEELAADHKRPRMFEPAEESAVHTDNAESTKTLSADSAN